MYENLKHRKLTARSAHFTCPSKNNTYTEVRRSPYYYGDLLKKGDSKEQSLKHHHHHHHHHESQLQHKCPKPVTTNVKPEPVYSNDFRYFDSNVNPFYIEEEIGDDDSTANRQRQMYETAFDSKICDSTQQDTVTNQAIEPPSFHHCPYDPAFYGSLEDQKCSLKRLIRTKGRRNNIESSVDSLTQHFTDLDIASQSTLLLSYSSASASASTSTVPLPQSVSSHLNDSFDSLTESSPKANQGRTNNLIESHNPRSRLMTDNHNINGNNIDNSSNNNNSHSKRKNINKVGSRHPHQKNTVAAHYYNDNSRLSDNVNNIRPKNCQSVSKILEIKSRPRERAGSGKSSSTESITSGSGGSLESIRSSTSEGNRSTTSTDSHQSSSMSSHSSDSAAGNGGFPLTINFPLGNRFLSQTKMHVLSPISDKSFQEMPSENSEVPDMNRPCDSSRASPEETERVTVNVEREQKHTNILHKTKRRPLPNQNIVSLNNSFSSGDAESYLCSDSGISMESASDKAKLSLNNDFSDLPFDMPKLRRRRLQQIQSLQSSVQDTSSNATSVDLKELPFDMPKIRRKLRSSSTQENIESAFCTASATTTVPHEDQLGEC